MAKITPLFKNTDHDMKAYHGKLFRHRAKQGLVLLGTAVLVAGLAIGAWLWMKNKTYISYEVMASADRIDTLNTQYAEYQGKILKYSRDGISCVNVRNEAVWSQTYNMQQPILDVCGKSVVVADKQGNEVYVFGAEGLQTQITTNHPVHQVSVSSQGVVAMLLNDSSTSWIYIYDNEGNKLADSRCKLEETGQPLSIAISQDGTKLAVSYLQVAGGMAGSCVTFYNFGPVGGNFVDKIVASKIYENQIIPRVEYLDDSVCAVISNEGIHYYEGKEIPEEKKSVAVEKEIYSLFFGEDAVGLVVEGTSESQNTFEVQLYDTNGELMLAKGTNLSYSKVKMSGEDLILFDENECEIYNRRGNLKYAGSFSGTIADMQKASGIRNYVVVFSDRTEEIRLN